MLVPARNAPRPFHFWPGALFFTAVLDIPLVFLRGVDIFRNYATLPSDSLSIFHRLFPTCGGYMSTFGTPRLGSRSKPKPINFLRCIDCGKNGPAHEFIDPGDGEQRCPEPLCGSTFLQSSEHPFATSHGRFHLDPYHITPRREKRHHQLAR